MEGAKSPGRDSDQSEGQIVGTGIISRTCGTRRQRKVYRNKVNDKLYFIMISSWKGGLIEYSKMPTVYMKTEFMLTFYVTDHSDNKGTCIMGIFSDEIICAYN